MFDETGFYRSTVRNISQYFLAFDQMLRQFSLNDIERDVWIFAMYYDLMIYVAQELRSLYRKGKSVKERRLVIKEVVTECSRKFINSNEELVLSMCAIVNESYPEPMCIKNGKSDFQAQKTVIWTSQMGNIEDTKDKLVDKMESNELDPNKPVLRRGCNATQGLVSNKKRKLNRTPRTPLGLKMILEGIPVLKTILSAVTAIHRRTIQRHLRRQWKVRNRMQRHHHLKCKLRNRRELLRPKVQE